MKPEWCTAGTSDPRFFVPEARMTVVKQIPSHGHCLYLGHKGNLSMHILHSVYGGDDWGKGAWDGGKGKGKGNRGALG